MIRRLRSYIFNLVIMLAVFCPVIASATDLRGIAITARDNMTGANREIKLYRQMHAVIIGIDKYPNLSPDRQLSYAVKDAKGIEKVLQEQYSFDSFYTLYNEQATRDGIMAVLQGKLSGIHEDDAVLIFFAGHGTTHKDRLTGDDIGYILPYDGTFNKAEMYKNISMTQIRDDVARIIPAKHIFYVIDACYSGTLLAQRAGGVNPSHDYAYLQEITNEPVRQVLTAGTDKQTVLDGGPKGHSVFTGRLIEKLEETDDYITAAELGEHVKRRVASDAQGRGHTQTPRDGSLYGLGDFVFVPSANKRALEIEKEGRRLEEELAKLKEQEQKKETWKIQKQREELESQKKALETKKKIEEMRKKQIEEAKIKEEEHLRQEEESKKQAEKRKRQEEERLAYIKTEISKKKVLLQEQPAGQLTVEEALERIKKLRSKLKEMQADIDKAVSEAVNQIRLDYARQLREANAAPKDEFESTAEYNKRLSVAEQKKRDIEEEQAKAENVVRAKFSQETAGIEKEIKELLMAEYPVSTEEVSVELDKYDADNKEMPVRVTWKSQRGVRGKIHGILEIEGQDARELKNHKEFLSTKSWVAINPSDLNINLSRLEIVDNTENGQLISAKIGGGWFNIDGGSLLDLGNGIIMHSESDLQWSQDAGSESMTWEQANDYVRNLKIGGYSDWRLPTKEELESLLVIAKSEGIRGKYHDFFNENGVKNVQSDFYWSSTSGADNPSYAWRVDMWDGVIFTTNKSNNFYVWPVRSGQLSAGSAASGLKTFAKEEGKGNLTEKSLRSKPPTADSSHGLKVYTANCVVCHGDKGDGKGPASATMNPKPRNFTSAIEMRGIDDARIKKSVKEGRPGTAMVGFGRTLREKDIEDVIAYIRSILKN